MTDVGGETRQALCSPTVFFMFNFHNLLNLFLTVVHFLARSFFSVVLCVLKYVFPFADSNLKKWLP